VIFRNPTDEERRALLKRVKTIAVLGLSPQPNRPSHVVAKAMQGFGYRIIPVRPAIPEILGEKCHPHLSAIPEPVDLVDVFRAAEHLPAIVEECIRLRFPAIWIQEGIVDDAAARRAQEAGMIVVMDRCIYKDFVQLCRD
jgi:predicted CoA-binding protein